MMGVGMGKIKVTLKIESIVPKYSFVMMGWVIGMGKI